MTSLVPNVDHRPRTQVSEDINDTQNVVLEPAGVITLENESLPRHQGISLDEKSSKVKDGVHSGNGVLEHIRHAISRNSTEDKDILQEIRSVPHHYLVQRPRALQYTYRGERIGYGDDAAPIQHEISGASDVKYTAEGVVKARERIDLFIDLVWVGIISNLSEVFSEVFFEVGANSGRAFLMFILVFLPAWRIWNFLREFLNSFYMDDSLQRIFIFWILALSVFFGNQIAYFAEDYEQVKKSLIVTYIVIRGSFVCMEFIYSFWIPWMRKLIFMGFLIMLPATGLWLGAIWTEGSHAIGPALAAILWEYLVPVILDTPLGEKLLPGEYRKEVDPIHLRGRMGNFLIITVGEGVLMLIRGGPLGINLNEASALGVWSLLVYFILAFLYFARDGSVRFVPAVRHKGLRLLCWTSLHIPIFASFITLSAGMLWLINRSSNLPIESAEAHELTEEEVLELRGRAVWNIAISISTILFSYLILALLDRPLDQPKTTLVHNRYIRLFGRPVCMAIILGVASVNDVNANLYLGICGVGLSLLTLYEMTLSLERPARVLEPKGLTVLMKREYRQELSRGEQETGHVRIPI